MKFYFNCERPLEIMADSVIRVSKLTKGVSMSQQYNLASHGPFKLEFTDPLWTPLMHRVLYMEPTYPQPVGMGSKRDGYVDQLGRKYTVEQERDLAWAFTGRVIKTTYFIGEEEWLAYGDIRFLRREVTGIYYMSNAPVIYPTVTAKARVALARAYPTLYKEVRIADPFYKKE